MTVLLLLLLQASNLPLTAEPLSARPAGERRTWLTAAEPGAVPALVMLEGSQATLVNLPPDTLFVAVAGDELTAVSPALVRRYRWRQGQGLAAVQRDQVIAPPLSRSHPWILLDWERVGERKLLAIFDRERLVLVGADDRSPSQISLKDAAFDPYLNTRVFGAEDGLHWNEGETFYRVSAADPPQLTHLAAPPHGDMAAAVVLGFARQQPVWLIHGGKRGSLDSFGWRLEAPGGVHSGAGIVTRFGVDRAAKRLKLIVFTVPNSLTGQLFRSFGSSRDFACDQILVSAQGQPSRADRFKVALAKTDRGKGAYELSWETDLNGDGTGDLILADARGLRLYASGASGFWSESARSLGGKVDALLFLPDRLLLANKSAKGWSFEERRSP